MCASDITNLKSYFRYPARTDARVNLVRWNSAGRQRVLNTIKITLEGF